MLPRQLITQSMFYFLQVTEFTQIGFTIAPYKHKADNSMKKITILLASIVLSVSSLPAQAKGNRPPPPSFEELDINGDGELSKDEIKGPLLRDFDQLDSDESGTLSKSELPDPPKPKR